MGDWSECFEGFPEENAANYVNGRLDPQAAQARRTRQMQQFELQAKLGTEVRTIAQRHRPQPKG